MKIALFLALTVTPAFAAKMDPVELFSKGQEIYNEAYEVGEVGYLLNPTFCFNSKTQKIVIAYSLDFRYKGQGYLLSANQGPEEINFYALGLEETNKGHFNGVSTSNVVFNGKKLFCVTSALVLEGVPGSF